MMQCISNSRKSCLVDANSCFCYMVIVFILSFIGSTMAFTTPVVPTINANNSIESCMNVKDFFISRGISDKDIPERRLKDINLKYCDVSSTAGTCCTSQMETKASQFARQVMEKNTKDAITKMSSTLSTRANKFHDLLRQLIAQSKEHFHQMFKQTYGTIYEQNSYVFSELFVKLEAYLLRGRFDLTEMLDKFFNQLYQKMFTVINNHYQFNDEYLNCVSQYMKELKPFGDVPDKVSVQVKRSFVATRAFVQSLTSASEVAKTMLNLRPLNECTEQLTKMSTCGACMGRTEKPCQQYCENVMKNCLQQYVELDAEWDSFVIQMEKIADRLLGPFNIVMVIDPINIKISEAIMNFQDNGRNISKQVFGGCGQPKLGRSKRSYPIYNPNSNADLFIDDDEDAERRSKRAADPSNTENNRRNNQEIKIEPYKFQQRESYSDNRSNRGRSSNRNNQRYSNSGNIRNDNSREPSLDKLIKEIKQKVKDTKKFWSNLPYSACNNEELPTAGNSDSCWNGQSVNRYIPSIKSSDNSGTTNVRQNQMVLNQIRTLKTSVEQLKKAFNGVDIDWHETIDNNEDTYEHSGSGGEYDDDDDDDDSGSGDGARITDIDASTEEPTIVQKVPTHTTNTDKNDDHHINNELHPETSPPPTPDSASSHWREKRIIITYFLPIVMAWFGGSISAAVSELL